MIRDLNPYEAYAATYAALVRASPGCRVEPIGRPGSLTCTVTPFPYAAFNRVMDIRLRGNEIEDAIEAVTAAHGGSGGPGSWWLDPHTTPAGLERVLVQRGYRPEASAPLMIMDLAALPAPEQPMGARVSLVRGREAMRRAQRVAALGFGRPPNVAETMADVLAPLGDQADSPIRVFAATLDGVPVGAATSITVDDVCGVFTVATLSEARGRGLGRATTLAILHDARERGARIGVLHASPLGFGVYARMGFGHAGDFQRFASAP